MTSLLPQARLHSCFSVCGLYVVGSSLNGFGTNSSDMDLCLMITNKDVSLVFVANYFSLSFFILKALSNEQGLCKSI